MAHAAGQYGILNCPTACANIFCENYLLFVSLLSRLNTRIMSESSGTQQKGVNGGLAFSIYLKAKCEDKYYVFDENGKQILDKDANYQTYALGVHTNYYYNEQLTATVKENTDYQWIGTGLTKNGWGSVKIANSIGKK